MMMPKWEVQHRFIHYGECEHTPSQEKYVANMLTEGWEIIGMATISDALGELQSIVYGFKRKCGEVEMTEFNHPVKPL